MSKVQEFIDHIEQEVLNHSIYVWGGQGERGSKVTEAWIRYMERNTGRADDAVAAWKKKVAAGYGMKLAAFDCSGLGMYYLISMGLLKSDTTADGLRRMCDRIDKERLRKGDFVFRVSNGNAYHIGYVADDALNVVEAKGRADGVIKRSLNAQAGYWNAFGRPTKIFGGEQPQPGPEPEPAGAPGLARVLGLKHPYMKGDDVRQAQRFLINAKCSCGSTGADGVFGGGTESAVRAYQKEKKLKVDGEIGRKTWESFGGKWTGR